MNQIKKTNITNTFENIEYVVFDFDCTLTDVHLYHLLDSEKTTVEALGRPPYKNEKVCESLKELFEFLKKHNKKILIASRNYNDVIYHYIRQNIDPEFNIINIFSDRMWFFNSNFKVPVNIQGKLKCFKLLNSLKIPMDRVLFIDDSYQEIRNIHRLYPYIQYYWKYENEILTLDNVKLLFSYK